MSLKVESRVEMHRQSMVYSERTRQKLCYLTTMIGSKEPIDLLPCVERDTEFPLANGPLYCLYEPRNYQIKLID